MKHALSVDIWAIMCIKNAQNL